MLGTAHWKDSNQRSMLDNINPVVLQIFWDTPIIFCSSTTVKVGPHIHKSYFKHFSDLRKYVREMTVSVFLCFFVSLISDGYQIYEMREKRVIIPL